MGRFQVSRHAYGWVITADHLAEPGAEPGSWAENAATVMGPRAISPTLADRLRAGEGRTFRLYDDDGELYYSGRIVFVDRSAENGDPNAVSVLSSSLPDEAFGPLYDFGMPNAGAVEIRYRQGGKWVTL